MRQFFGFHLAPEDCYRLYPGIREVVQQRDGTSYYSLSYVFAPPFIIIGGNYRTIDDPTTEEEFFVVFAE